MLRDEVIKFIKENKDYFKEKYGVKEIYLFGSVARGEESEKSDIDLLVEFDESKIITMLKYMQLVREFEERFNKHVDLATKDMIKPLIMKYIQEDLIDATR